jgi:hypothetical protein
MKIRDFKRNDLIVVHDYLVAEVEELTDEIGYQTSI